MRAAFPFILTLLVPVAGHAASFNCDLTTLTPNEQVICQNRDLNDLDVEMATMYRLLSGLFGMGMRGAMHDDQSAWLHTRMACGADAGCIRGAYNRRLEELRAIYDGIDRPI